MDATYLYLVLALAFSAGILFYYFSFKTVKQPKTDLLFTDALNYMVRGDNSEAVRILRQVVKQDSNHVRAYLQLGNILRDENTEQAIKIHQSLTVRPNLSAEMRVDIHRSLANDYKKIGSYSKAKKEAEQILAIEKRNLWSLNFLIDLAKDNQSWDEAASWTKKLNKITGSKNKNDEASFDVYRGLDCLKNSQLEDARLLFEKSIKVSPDFGLAYRYLGDVFEQTRDLLKALENWKIFAKKDFKGGAVVYGKIESALFDLGQYSEVEKFYRQILDLDPSNFEAIIRLANVLDEKGESVAAHNLVENATFPGVLDVRADIMKLKLSLVTSTPVDLSHQIDNILEKLSQIDET